MRLAHSAVMRRCGTERDIDRGERNGELKVRPELESVFEASVVARVQLIRQELSVR
jgi:hypothetical protein